MNTDYIEKLKRAIVKRYRWVGDEIPQRYLDGLLRGPLNKSWLQEHFAALDWAATL